VELEKLHDAKAYYLRALEIEPANKLASQMMEAMEGRQWRAGADPEAYHEVHALIKNGDHDGAIHQLEKLLQANPDYGVAHNDLGFLYYEKGEKKKALDHYERAVELDPKNMTSLKNLAGFYYVELKDADRAVSFYNKILSVDPRDLETLLILGNIHTSQRKLEFALAYYRKAVEIDPDNAQASMMIEALNKHAPYDPSSRPQGPLPLDLHPVSSLEDYQQYVASMSDQSQARRRLEKNLRQKRGPLCSEWNQNLLKRKGRSRFRVSASLAMRR